MNCRGQSKNLGVGEIGSYYVGDLLHVSHLCVRSGRGEPA